MKHKILLFLLLAAGFSSSAQSGIKLYGYVRDALPGTVARGTDENGKRIETGPRTEYLLYLSYPAKTRIEPTSVWINHKIYAVHAETVARTPVVITNGGSKKILIGATKNKVLKLTPVTYGDQKEWTTARAQAAKNDVVLAYQYKGKLNYVSLKQLTRLEPLQSE